MAEAIYFSASQILLNIMRGSILVPRAKDFYFQDYSRWAIASTFILSWRNFLTGTKSSSSLLSWQKKSTSRTSRFSGGRRPLHLHIRQGRTLAVEPIFLLLENLEGLKVPNFTSSGRAEFPPFELSP